MKRFMALLLAFLMVFSLTACGKAGVEPVANEASEKSSAATPRREYDESDPAAVLAEIVNDFDDVASMLEEKLAETFDAVGTTYEDYQKNKGLVDEWIDLVLSESEALFARTKENSIAYFKLIAADEDHKYSEFCEEALDEYYDDVYGKAMDEYYDSLYDDAMDDLFDEYYNGIVDDAYDDLAYDEWKIANDESYDQWSETRSAIYEMWSDEHSYIYGLWWAVYSAFCWDDNFDVDSIVAEYDAEKAEEDARRAEEEAKVYVDLDVIYEINSDGDAEVVGFSGDGNLATIASEYDGKAVVRIADSAFEDCTTLEKIVLWADPEEIGNSAFKGCTGLTEISIPSSTVLIGHHAFEGCSSLESLIIWGDPDIGEYAFADCVSLTDISIGSYTKNIGAHAFEGCTGVTALFIWGVDIIGDYAFAGCTGIESVDIPDEARSIGNHAFDGCTALSTVFVWGDDTAIGENAFANCPNLEDAPAARGTVLECTISGAGNDGDNMESETESTQSETTEAATDSTDIRPEFKEAMDSYEAFYSEYCDLLKEYSENPTDLSLLAKYTGMLVKAEEMDAAFEAWDDEEMNDAEVKYYLDVNNRIMQMLVDVAG